MTIQQNDGGEMKRPEKKDLEDKSLNLIPGYITPEYQKAEGYNKAIEDFEAFLPDKKEIEKILEDNIFLKLESWEITAIRKEIYKRLRGGG